LPIGVFGIMTSQIGNSQSEIGNVLVEAPRIELGSRSQRRGIYMLSRFSGFSGKPEKVFAQMPSK